MARMFPEHFPVLIDAEEREKRETEKRIYDLLSKNLPSQFVVFYSVPWLAKNRKAGATDNEVDFLVVHPHHGLLIIEVKGGGVSYDGRSGKWISTDRHGVSYEIDPYQQVKRQFYGLRNKLRESPLTQRFVYPMARAVWLPSLRIGSRDLRIDAPREITLDNADMTVANVQAAILRAFEYCPREDDLRRFRSGGHGDGLGYGRSAIDALIQLLAPTFQIQSPLGAQFASEDEVIRQLTEEQFDVLRRLAKTRQMSICGCAGSGKTFLAVEKARRLAREGYSVLLTCFNRPLADYLTEVIGSSDRISVQTYFELCLGFARKARLPLDASLDVSEKKRQYPRALFDALDIVPDRFDAILVDEGQDFDGEAWLPLQMALRDPDDGVFYVFFDDNQVLYSEELSEFPTSRPPFHLTVNCRNTRAIHEAVQHYYRGTHQLSCPGAEGRDVERLRVDPGPSKLIEALRRVIHRIVVVGEVDIRDIAVLLIPTP